MHKSFIFILLLACGLTLIKTELQHHISPYFETKFNLIFNLIESSSQFFPVCISPYSDIHYLPTKWKETIFVDLSVPKTQINENEVSIKI